MDVYTTLKHLGKGTYGNVYLCEKVHNKQKVVMKKIECDAESEIVEQTKNEAKILKILNHPNIIQYNDSYFRDGTFHIIMEYATQGTLYDYIKKRRPNLMSKQWVLSMFWQILLGLNCIHKKKIVQRDLKTENIFLSGINGEIVKIGDFGASKLLQDSDKTMTTIGTPNYVAPEVCNGLPYGIQSDIWALGCVLFELCAMERLFDGSVIKVVMDIKSGVRKRINTDIYGNGVQEIIDAATQMNPLDRPTTQKLLDHEEINPVRMRFVVNLGNIEI